MPPHRRIYIQEVAPRDGFQNERTFVATEAKVRLINALSRTGVSKIEVSSFTSPRAIPTLADAEAVFNDIERVPGVTYAALVPNMRGAERAFTARADEFNLVMSVSETHNLTNLKMTREQSARTLGEVVTAANEAGIAARISLSCVFGCPMEGDIPIAEVESLAAQFIEAGASGVTLCDTTGMAYPSQVTQVVTRFKSRWPTTSLALHFHDTRGLGLANVYAGIEAGADTFDAALGGLGGCPYAPGASGNICTEDTVHMLELMGYHTGVNLQSLLECAELLPKLVGHEVPSHLLKAGRRLDLHAVPASFEATRLRADSR